MRTLDEPKITDGSPVADYTANKHIHPHRSKVNFGNRPNMRLSAHIPQLSANRGKLLTLFFTAFTNIYNYITRTAKCKYFFKISSNLACF